MNTLELAIYRRFKGPEYTIGRFTADGIYFCDTLEDKVRELVDLNNDGDFNDPGEGKVYGETAIPPGKYKVFVSESPKLGRRLPMIWGVYGFSGIRIHWGKNAKWSEGCPLLGENRIKGGLVNGKHYEDLLVAMIDKATEEGKKTFITIS